MNLTRMSLNVNKFKINFLENFSRDIIVIILDIHLSVSLFALGQNWVATRGFHASRANLTPEPPPQQVNSLILPAKMAWHGWCFLFRVSSVKSNRRADGFTLVEMLVVIAIIGLLAALLLPVFGQAKARAKRIECVSDLREIGVACHVFANDHGGKYPTQVSTNDGGSLEFVAAGYQIPGDFYFSFKFLRPLASALATPKLFACPADLDRLPAVNFNQLSNSNLSYDVGIVTDANDPRWLLAADRGLPAGWTNADTIRHVPVPFPPRWAGAHGSGGNILFADGHVDLSSDATVPSEESVAEDVVYPSVQGSAIFSTAGGSGGGSGGGTPPASQGSAAPQNSVASQNRTTSQTGDTSLAATTPRQTAQTGPATNQPVTPMAARPLPVASPNRPNAGVNSIGQSEVAVADSVPEKAAAPTNSTAGRGTSQVGDDSMMSPFNRELAGVLRDIIFGTYFLILLLVLLFAACRIWRWTQDPKRQRRP